MPKLPHVALLIETSRSYSRAILAGVRQYCAEHAPWSIFMELRALDSPEPRWLAGWKGDGILTRTGSKAMARAVRVAKVPAVELRTTRFGLDLPFVGVDNRAVGRLVAEHLLERGFRQFGFYDLPTEDYFRERRESFLERLGEAGFAASVFRAGRGETPRSWERQQDELVAWVAGLPKPIGLMACTDQLGFWLLDACTRGGVSVPEEAAVVGVENEETLCLMSSPPLSSVQFDGARIGHTAATLLARLMAGKRSKGQMLIPPLGIVVRRSSDVVALEDAELAAALRMIRERACDGLNVDRLLEQLALSRSTLERGLRAATGRSPHDEIVRVRLERACQLLRETDLPLAAIARRSGFAHAQYLCEVFRKRFGQTPGTFRTSSKI
jgi:LacI family transcriptional regulator